MAALDIADIHVFLGDSYIIQGASLALDSGRTVAVIGRNGVGKTTLVRSVMGLTDPARRGAIRWRGADITRWPTWRRTHAGLGYVPQGRRIFPSLSVEENLQVALRTATAAAPPWTLERIYGMFPILRERRRQPGTTLSGGEQQMLAIARALAGNPEAVLLDEPSEGLAPIMVERILEVLRTLKSAGYAFLLIEQNHRFVAELADEIYVMQAGRMVFHGSAMSRQQVEAVAERYLSIE
jgi:branched-chain amino acid transport system ATP-binding protein